MAGATETIGTGQDRATITLWAANVGTLTGTDIFKGVISTNEEFNENVTITGAGTGSATTYYHLTVAEANRHSGVAGDGHARMRGDTNGSHVLFINKNWTRVDWLDIYQNSRGNSDEGIRVGSSTQVSILIDYCIIHGDNIEDQDGIYTGDWNIDMLRISNSIIYGFQRSCINIQQYGTTGRTITLDVEHCTLMYNPDPVEGERGALGVRSSSTTDDITITMYNNIGYMEADTDEPFHANDGTNRGQINNGTFVWNGSHNLAGDQSTHDDMDSFVTITDNVTNWQHATDGDVDTTQTTGSYVVFADQNKTTTSPTVRASTESLENSDVTAHNLPMTAAIAGDRALAFLFIDNDGSSVTVSGMPAGWRFVTGGQEFSVGGMTVEVWELLNCTGSETDFDYTTSSSQKSKTRVLFIEDSSDTLPTIRGASWVSLASTNPNPPLVRVPWGFVAGLWIAAYICETMRGNATGYPTDYTLANFTNTDTANDTTNVAYAIAARETNNWQQDPGTFTKGFGDRELTSSMMVPPAGDFSLLLLDDAAGNLAAGNATNRQGSEPDGRQDFSVAINGARPTTNVDIGAAQLQDGADFTGTVAETMEAYVSTTTGEVTGLLRFFPASDITTADWDSYPTNSQSLFSQIDEAVRSDTDYIQQDA